MRGVKPRYFFESTPILSALQARLSPALPTQSRVLTEALPCTTIGLMALGNRRSTGANADSASNTDSREGATRSAPLVLLAHPIEDSLNRAIADQACKALRKAGLSPRFHDLYREQFDPVLPEDEVRRRFTFDETIQTYFREVQEAPGFVFVHPDWWGGPPAILKGWLDRVFRPGVAYDFQGEEFLEKEQVPLLTGRWAIALSTTDARRGEAPHPIETVWSTQVFEFCGISPYAVEIMHDVRNSTYRMRRDWLRHAGRQVQALAKGTTERRAQ